MTNFANRFRNLRNERQLTQEDLSKVLDISKSTISMYEHGYRTPDFETLEKIADYFNVDMNYLLGYASRRHVPIYEQAANGRKFQIYFEKLNKLNESQLALVEKIVDELLKEDD